jgi:magnesium chelatase family protein
MKKMKPVLARPFPPISKEVAKGQRTPARRLPRLDIEAVSMLAASARSYIGKISGPLLDRIAIHVTVRSVDVEAWSGADNTSRLTSAAMRDLVVRAREIQVRRFAQTNGVDCNARITEGMFATHCAMEPPAEALFVRAQKSLLVSARARGHIVRVARTIGDLEGSERIAERHVAEAVGYRGRER